MNSSSVRCHSSSSFRSCSVSPGSGQRLLVGGVVGEEPGFELRQFGHALQKRRGRDSGRSPVRCESAFVPPCDRAWRVCAAVVKSGLTPLRKAVTRISRSRSLVVITRLPDRNGDAVDDIGAQQRHCRQSRGRPPLPCPEALKRSVLWKRRIENGPCSCTVHRLVAVGARIDAGVDQFLLGSIPAEKVRWIEAVGQVHAHRADGCAVAQAEAHRVHHVVEVLQVIAASRETRTLSMLE